MLRIRKNYRCIVEGQQEKMYLIHLEKLLTKFPQVVVKFNASIGKAYELSKTYEDYDKACLFDFDFNKVEFEKNLQICHSLNKKCRKARRGFNVYHAYTNVCFDLWLILHKQDYNASVCSNNAYVQEVIKVYDLPKDADIKNSKVIEKILEQITLEDVKAAIERAKRIKGNKNPDDANLVNDIVYYDNPDFSLHDFLDIAIKSVNA